MRHVIRSIVAAAVLVSPLAAQQPGDSGIRAMRQRVEERLAERVKERLGLDDAQTAKLREVARSWGQRRRAFEAEERDLKRALVDQMRPGVAADADSVTRLTQRLLDLRVAYAESYRSEYRELGFLTPVQRAQFFALRERVLEMARRFRAEREGAGMGPGGGARWRRRMP
jgi:hypothetical protein